MKKNIVLLILLLAALPLAADRLQLTDGSVVNGKLISILNNTATFSTAFAGDLKIPQNMIRSLETDQDVTLLLTGSETPASARFVTGSNGQTTLLPGGQNVAPEALQALWTQPEMNPLLPPQPTWTGEIYADVTGKTGNSEKFRSTAGFRTSYTRATDRITLAGAAAYARENSTTNEEDYLGMLEYEFDIDPQGDAWYIRGEAERDEIIGLDLRAEAMIGYGYHLISDDVQKLRLRVGVGYIEKRWNNGENESGLGGDVELRFERDFAEYGKLVSRLTYTPTFEDFQNYRLYHESFWEVPLRTIVDLALRLGVANEYYNQPAPGSKNMDTTYFARIVYKW